MSALLIGVVLLWWVLVSVVLLPGAAYSLGWLNLRNLNVFAFDGCRFSCLGVPPNTLLLCERVDRSVL